MLILPQRLMMIQTYLSSMENTPHGYKDNGEPDILITSGSQKSYQRFAIWMEKQRENARKEHEMKHVTQEQIEFFKNKQIYK